MCTGRNKRKAERRLPCPLPNVLLLHRTRIDWEGRMLIFHTQIWLSANTLFWLTPESKGLLTRWHVFALIPSRQLPHPKEKSQAEPSSSFQQQMSSLLWFSSQPREGWRWNEIHAVVFFKNTRCNAEAMHFWCYVGLRPSVSWYSILTSPVLFPCDIDDFPIMTPGSGLRQSAKIGITVLWILSQNIPRVAVLGRKHFSWV